MYVYIDFPFTIAGDFPSFFSIPVCVWHRFPSSSSIPLALSAVRGSAQLLWICKCLDIAFLLIGKGYFFTGYGVLNWLVEFLSFLPGH